MGQRWDAKDALVLQLDDNNSIVIHFHGATVLSWKCQGKEVLFLSEKAVFDNKKAIRGGIPLVFPCFGPWKYGPQHGFARIKRWKVEKAPSKDQDSCQCSLSLENDEETLKSWDYRFKLVYTVQLKRLALHLTLSVENTDSKPFEFTTLMHTYFGCSDISKTVVTGLKGKTYVDKVRDGNSFQEDRDEVLINQNYDRVYQDCLDGVSLKPSPGVEVSLALQNMSDIVVWNPWSEKAKAMSDFDDDEYKTMICVEAGAVSSDVSINGAGETKTFSQTITVKSQL